MSTPPITPIHKGRVFEVRQERVTLPNGVTVTLDMVRHPGAAAVVALDGNEQITLVHQFRHAVGGFIWEVPAGTLHPGEAPEACARRELQEEAGLMAAEWTHLGSIFTAPGFCDERIHLYLARGLSPVAAQLDHDEVLSTSAVALVQALDMIGAGKIEDAKSIAALHHTAVVLGYLGPRRSRRSTGRGTTQAPNRKALRDR